MGTRQIFSKSGQVLENFEILKFENYRNFEIIERIEIIDIGGILERIGIPERVGTLSSQDTAQYRIQLSSTKHIVTRLFTSGYMILRIRVFNNFTKAGRRN